MDEFRFLNVCADETLPTFVRIEAETRMDAIESFSSRFGLVIRRVGDETVQFAREGRCVLYSVSGTDPFLRVLLG